ncbi:FlaA1/EpsC-like NDP-sugar epimerase [Herbaspirillum sp. SJZ099]|nr:FlaA1/EpsC-like NDP-sugar epimerase [Herbaspirillum sp. SJZ099]
MPRAAKRILVVSVDIFLGVFTVWLAFCLRLDWWGRPGLLHLWPMLYSICFSLPIFVRFGLYRAIFRYSGMAAFHAICKAMAIYFVLFAGVFTLIGIDGIPRSVGIIQPVLFLVCIGGSRLLVQYWFGGMYQSHWRRSVLPQVLIYGAGSAGRQLAAVLAHSREMVAAGFVDDDVTLQGNTINGLSVFAPEKIKDVIGRLHITDVLLAIPSASRSRRHEILTMLRPYSLHVRTLPGLMDLAYGRINLTDVRELDIEDLLGRDPVEPDDVLLRQHIEGKLILVTGAGGSIGSELCRQIVKCQPTKLILVELSEFALYAIHRELLSKVGEQGCDIELVPLLASVRDVDHIDNIFRTWKPHTIYHAAAYKHVPLVEHNPAEGIKNNVIGTLTVARLAAKHSVANFVLISTDKAVRPTNIMGASKRLAEMVLQAMSQQMTNKSFATKFSMVRFGNVLGSSGSVVPLFREQIKNGGPITLTHEDITRYFMTIPEAAQLVIQAGAMAEGGDVFVLDMGEPVKIIDLARRMVELSGLTMRDDAMPDGDITITVTGLRPGEKLYEELLIGDNPQRTQHPRIMKAHEAFFAWDELDKLLAVLTEALEVNDIYLVRKLLSGMVSGYEPTGEVVDWIFLEQERQESYRNRKIL